MEQVYLQWQEVPQNQWKISALKEIILRAGLIGKNSTPYSAAVRHNYMHNKVLVIDDTVITGSYISSRAGHHCRRHLSRGAFRIQTARPCGPLRLDRCRSFLCP